jgi:hypothetical protein
LLRRWPVQGPEQPRGHLCVWPRVNTGMQIGVDAHAGERDVVASVPEG